MIARRIQELWGASSFFRGAILLAGLCFLVLLASHGGGGGGGGPPGTPP